MEVDKGWLEENLIKIDTTLSSKPEFPLNAAGLGGEHIEIIELFHLYT